MFRGISGLRVGWMHTLNQDLTGAMDSLAYFCMPSTIIQEAATQMLLDKPFVTAYLKENQQRLARSYDALIGACVINTSAMLAGLAALCRHESCSLSANSRKSIPRILLCVCGERSPSYEIGTGRLCSVMCMRHRSC